MELSELVHDTMRSGFLEFGWSIPTDVMSQVADRVREAVENFEGEPEETTAEQTMAYLEETADATEDALDDHEKRIVALERAVRSLSRPKRLRRPSSAVQTAEEAEEASEGVVFDLDAVHGSVERERFAQSGFKSLMDEHGVHFETADPLEAIKEVQSKVRENFGPAASLPSKAKWCSACFSDSHDYPDCPATPEETVTDCLEGELS